MNVTCRKYLEGDDEGGFLKSHATLAICFTTFAFCLFLTYQLTQSAQWDIDQKTQAYFDFRVREAIERVENRLQSYRQVLYGAAGLFEASKQVDRDEFRQYVDEQHLSQYYPGIQGVGFSLVIPAAQKDQHIARIRREGFVDYTLRPAGLRDIYTSIVYLEPFIGRNLRAFGYDMYSEPVRHAAMLAALENNQTSLSGKVTLVQDLDVKKQAGFLMYFPIYSNAHRHDTLSERRANILGWVYAPFRMNDFMKGILGEQASDLDMEIYDGMKIAANTLMYDSDEVIGALSLVNSSYQNYSLKFADHTWLLRLRPAPSIIARFDTSRPKLIATVGTIISFLLSGLLAMLLSGRTVATKVAQRMNKELIDEQQRLELATRAAQLGIWDYDIKKNIIVWDDQMFALYGVNRSDFSSAYEAWLSRLHPDDLVRCDHEIKDAIAGIKPFSTEFRVIHADDSIRVIKAIADVFCDAQSVVVRMVGVSWDVTELAVQNEEKRKRADELYKLAFHDPLTQMPNRALFFDRFSQMLSRAQRDKSQVALIFADLDGFKNINDLYGHKIGDGVLQIVAQRLNMCLRETDTAARLGGDEFAIIIGSFEDARQVALVADKIIHSVNAKMILANGIVCHVGVSIGISLFPENGRTMDQLLAGADIAMYDSKLNGKNIKTFCTGKLDSGGEAWIEITAQNLLGIDELDEQHSNLARLINLMNIAWESGCPQKLLLLFNELINATAEHFACEEHFMSQCAYPDQSEHEASHQVLIKMAGTLYEQLSHGSEPLALQTLKDWLLNHIIEADKPMVKYMLRN